MDHYVSLVLFFESIIVLIFLCYDNTTEMFLAWNKLKKAIFLFGVYFALFSNLFHSAITAVYAGVQLLITLQDCKKGVKQYIKKNKVFCLLILSAAALRDTLAVPKI